MSAKDHFIIIGNGPAGNNAAEVLRENDKKARISIISTESFSFYYRHRLKDFISGRIPAEDLVVKHYSEYKDKNIRLRLGQFVEKIDPEKKILYLKHMEKINYTKLIIATGGSPRILPSLTIFQDYLTMFSTYSDTVGLRHRIEKAKEIVVLGGDLTSFSFVKSLVKACKKVSFLLFNDAFWPISLTSEMILKIEENLKSHNVATFFNDSVEMIKKSKSKYTIETKQNNKIKSDIIISLMGMIPNIRFILGSSIDTDRGVLVDAYLRTNFKDIYAAGDCAQIYNPILKNYWVSIGWMNAEEQGKIAALNLLGDSKIIEPPKEEIFEYEGIKVNTSWWKKF
ncbi:MAG: NAD(P)/FAD-dependent oxidoreductase [Desulfobacterales bacterium]|nr:NAD(P)/FAD-dependent oxidoreductase [Desulfobacterales bacterium]